MPIVDINNIEIVPHQNFPNDMDVENIEIGASKNYFGKKYYPFCYLTDKFPVEGLFHFTETAEYDETNCHFLDYVGDFFELQIDRTFNNIIICNPYGFGFQGKEYSKLFLNKAGNLLNDGGSMIVIGNSKNGWSKYESANKWLTKLTLEGELNYSMQISQLQILQDTHEFRVNHTFNKIAISEPTKPNEMFTIQKI